MLSNALVYIFEFHILIKLSEFYKLVSKHDEMKQLCVDNKLISLKDLFDHQLIS